MPHAQEELTLGFGCVGEQGPFRDVAGGEGGCGYLGEAEVGRDVATKIPLGYTKKVDIYSGEPGMIGLYFRQFILVAV